MDTNNSSLSLQIFKNEELSMKLREAGFSTSSRDPNALCWRIF